MGRRATSVNLLVFSVAMLKPEVLQRETGSLGQVPTLGCLPGGLVMHVWFKLNLYWGGGANLPPGSFLATAQKRLALDCRDFVTIIVSLLHIIWYTFWSPGT